MDYLSDIPVFFADSGDSAVLRHGVNNTVTLPGIFENDYNELNLQIGSIGTSSPAYICASATAVDAEKGDTLTVTSPAYAISEVLYYIEDVKRGPADPGPGITRLVLKKT